MGSHSHLCKGISIFVLFSDEFNNLTFLGIKLLAEVLSVTFCTIDPMLFVLLISLPHAKKAFKEFFWIILTFGKEFSLGNCFWLIDSLRENGNALRSFWFGGFLNCTGWVGACRLVSSLSHLIILLGSGFWRSLI